MRRRIVSWLNKNGGNDPEQANHGSSESPKPFVPASGPNRKRGFSPEALRQLHGFPIIDDVQILPEPPITTGGFCEVYKGVFTRKGTKKGELVAMKCPKAGNNPDSGRKDFVRETAAWMELSHPNVLPFYGTFVLENNIYMVSPWAENGPLIEYLKRKPDANRQALLVQIANALSYIHEDCNIVHGDVKPDNVLISRNGDALLADFGLVTHLQIFIPEVTETAPVTRTAATMKYAAPEILFESFKETEADRPVKSRATDVYAFGMVILEVYTMERPWKNHPPWVVLAEVTKGGKPPRPEGEAIARGFTSSIWNLVEICLESDSAKRPCMSDLATSIELRSVPSGAADLSGEISERFLEDTTLCGACHVGKRRKKGSDEKVLLKKPKKMQLLQGEKKLRSLIQSLTLIQHPNILSVYGTARVGRQLFIVAHCMEMVDIVTYLEKYQPPQAIRFKLLHQISDALSYLHSGPVESIGPIIHGSLHPENIWITSTGDIRLTDFGLSKVSDVRLTGLESSPSLSNVRVMDVRRSNILQDLGVYSPNDSQDPETAVRFLPQEFFVRPNHPATKEGDVYAFAMVMFQMLTDIVPFADTLDSFPVIVRIINGKLPQRPRTAGEAIDDLAWKLITDCWSHKPEDRPRMDQVRIRLASFNS